MHASERTGHTLIDRLREMYGHEGLKRISLALPLDQLGRNPRPSRRAPEYEVIVSCYPDQLSGDASGARVAATLRRLNELLSTSTAIVRHVLPPYLSDSWDRFSLIDDSVLDPALGDWSDLRSPDFALMLDLIINQLSVNSPQFRAFTRGDVPSLFFSPDESFDFGRVASPRGRGHLRRVPQAGGEVGVWSSHGGQQIDLDYRSPEVLAWTLERLRRLSGTARDLRLDGIAFSWKQSGTECANLPQSRVLSDTLCTLWRILRPDGYVVAEVDMYDDERAYVRQSCDDGPDLVYNYELPRCAAIALVLGDVGPLAAEVERLAARHPVHWCNIIGTHDGISLRPWVPTAHQHLVERLVQWIEQRSTLPVQHMTFDTGILHYEVDGLPADLDVPAQAALGVAAPHCAHLANSLLMTLRGVPFAYLPALLGVSSAPIAADLDQRSRVRIAIPPSLTSDDPHVGVVVGTALRMLELRTTMRALSASSPMYLRRSGDGLLMFSRGDKDDLYVVHNFSASWRTIDLDRPGVELLSMKYLKAGVLKIPPRAALWIQSR